MRIKHVGLWVAIVITVLTAGIPFALGKYIELNSPGPFDSGAYVYSAQHLLNGARLGIEEHASAQPLTLIVNILGIQLFGFNDVGPKIIQMLFQLSAGVFMFYTLRRVFGTVAAVLGVTIAAVYLSSPMIAKFGNVKEQFMIAFMIYAVCCILLHELTFRHYWLVLCGFFALQPFFFKATGLSVVAAILVYLFLKNLLAGKWKALCAELLLFLGGYTVGLIVPASLYIWQNQPGQIFQTFPAVVALSGLAMTVLLSLGVYGCTFVNKTGVVSNLKTISKTIWLAGAILIPAALAISIFLIHNAPQSTKGDIQSYLENLPFVVIAQKAFLPIRIAMDELIHLSQSSYVTDSRAAIDYAKLIKQIGRYYLALKAPILAALTSICVALYIGIKALIQKHQFTIYNLQFTIWLLAIWWILDMAFVWISPRSYEEYYLPLCGSAAFVSGYAVWVWNQKLSTADNKMPWLAAGFGGILLLGLLSIPTFIGQRYSPDTGADYIKNYGARRRGFIPALKEIPLRQKGAWQAVGDYVRTHSTADDALYVWGWVPGIYVQAQRLAPVSHAFESDMHVKPPAQLKAEMEAMVETFQQHPPKFIVDARKREFPNDRPPLELWPIVPAKMFGNDKPRFLNNVPQEVAAFDASYATFLEKQINPDEARRYEAMKPLRDFVMNHYRIVGQFGEQVLFEYKP